MAARRVLPPDLIVPAHASAPRMKDTGPDAKPPFDSSSFEPRIFDRFADAGGTFIDTAASYQVGEAEEILGRLLDGRRDAFTVATALADAIRDEKFDLVLTGLQSDDQGFGQVGVVLAEKLGMPHATIIMDVQVDGGGLRVKRELEGGWFQWVALPLPALLTIQSGINQLRYATLKGIMAAKKKEIRKAGPLPAAQPALQIIALYVPEKAKKTELLTGPPADAARQLVAKLRDEARVIQ